MLKMVRRRVSTATSRSADSQSALNCGSTAKEYQLTWALVYTSTVVMKVSIRTTAPTRP